MFIGWNDHPPVYVSLQALMQGFGVKTQPTAAVATDAEIHKLAASSQGGLRVMRDPGLPKTPVVLSVEELHVRNAARLKERLKKRA